mmetsp:Transcript_13346/g.15093  ORF Transcript_13346/g.15093 Transcript_13346/m.15093 type:complete len:112 (+) Transcript_13346:922-1257(+)
MSHAAPHFSFQMINKTSASPRIFLFSFFKLQPASTTFMSIVPGLALKGKYIHLMVTGLRNNLLYIRSVPSKNNDYCHIIIIRTVERIATKGREAEVVVESQKRRRQEQTHK